MIDCTAGTTKAGLSPSMALHTIMYPYRKERATPAAVIPQSIVPIPTMRTRLTFILTKYAAMREAKACRVVDPMRMLR
jgi:hypothetical protein